MTSKSKIIRAAEELFWKQGYKNTSIDDILKKTKISKGSLFHFFTNKKALTLEVIDYFYEIELVPLFEKHFQNKKNPQKQILNFCTEINEIYKKYDFRGGCLLGNLALELSDLDEVFRIKLDENFTKWEKELIEVLAKIKSKKSSQEIADFIIWGIEGLTLTGKVHKQKSKNASEFALFLKILKNQMK